MIRLRGVSGLRFLQQEWLSGARQGPGESWADQANYRISWRSRESAVPQLTPRNTRWQLRYHSLMSLWQRYQTWEPERLWDRYRMWQLESRGRYVVTAAGVRALIVFFISWLIADSSVSKALLVTSAFVAVAVFVYGWVWYPRAKTKSQQALVPTRRAAV